MRSPLLALIRLQLKATFAIRLPAGNEWKNPRTILKTFGWALLALLLLVDFTFLFGSMDYALIEALAPLGMQSYMLLNAIATASVLVFVLTLLTSLSFFSAAPNELVLVTMPLAPRDLLLARMTSIYAVNAPFALFIVVVALVMYGLKMGAPFWFYPSMVLHAAAIPLLPLALSYLLLVPLLSGSRMLRNRNAILYIGGIIGMLVALGFNFYLQRMMAKIQDPSYLITLMSNPASIVQRVARFWPPAWLAVSSAVTRNPGISIAAALANLVMGAGACIVITLLFRKRYVRLLCEFSEGGGGKGLRTDVALARLRAKPLLLTMLQREVALMNREPQFFLNGPFIILLFPLLFAIMYLAQRESFGELATILERPGASGVAYLLAAGFGIFLGSSTSITCTSISRDAKSLTYLKSLPIPANILVLGKLLHGLLFGLLGIVVGTGGLAVVMHLRGTDLAAALILALLGILASTASGLLLDLLSPRLKWEHPVSALKQNKNSVIMILGMMGLLGAMGYLTTVLSLPKYGYAMLYGGFFAVVATGSLLTMLTQAARRLQRMEP